MKRVLGFLKKLVAVATIAIALPTAKAEEKKDQVSKLNNQATLNMGYSNNNISGRNFSDGGYLELETESDFKVSNKICLEVDSKLENRILVYESEGNLNATDFDIGYNFTFKNLAKSFAPYASIGANLEIDLAYQNFIDSSITVFNVNAGPATKLGIDSKYVDVEIEYRFGFGQAGNSVHGNNTVMKHNAKAKLAVEIEPVRVEGYFDGKANLMKIKNTDRSDYHLKAGGNVSVNITENFFINAGYEYGMVLGNLDNVVEHLCKIGVGWKF